MKLNKTLKKNLLNNTIVVIIFLALAYIYCLPLVDGKVLTQDDIVQGKGMSKEIVDHRDQYGEEPLWTNSMFGGMTSFYISTIYNTNINYVINRYILGVFPSPVKLIFFLCIGMFILLRAMGVNIWLSTIGAIAFAFSSNYLISLEVGHNSKIASMGCSTGILGGIIYAFRGKLKQGLFIVMVFTGLTLFSNHVQIIYYFLILAGIICAYELTMAIKEKVVPAYLKTLGLIVIVGMIGLLPNIAKIWTVATHAKETMRGGSSELSRTKNKSGLQIDYAFQWSLKKDEILTSIVPYYMGGASYETLGPNSNIGKLATRPGTQPQDVQGVPLYFGEMPSTSGPNYFGATVFLLFILGVLLIKGPIKYWLLGGIILSFFLSWGRFFMDFNEFLFTYLPMYSKFRTPAMAIHIAGVLMPLLGMIGLSYFFKTDSDKAVLWKKLKIGTLISLGLLALLGIIGLITPFDRTIDLGRRSLQQFIENPQLYDALMADRKNLYLMDVLRSIIFIVLLAGTLYLYIKNKIKKVSYIYAMIGILMLADVWMVSKRYFNSDDFQNKSEYNSHFRASQADLQILKDTDPYYRVFNITGDPFNDALTSYYHKSIGGYSPAKLQRYQDLIDYYIRYTHFPVLNMLNTKYFIIERQGSIVPTPNPQALGHAWFVSDYRIVGSADHEMMHLDRVFEIRDETGGTLLIRDGKNRGIDTLGSYGTFKIAGSNDTFSVDFKTQQPSTGITLIGNSDTCQIKINRPGFPAIAASVREIFAFNPAGTAIVNQSFANYLNGFNASAGSTADFIKLDSYRANQQIYSSNSEVERLAVFSDVYYKDGWMAYIDNEPVDYIRVNYILRALKIPAGKHTIEFKFSPNSFKTGIKIAMAGSGIYTIALLGMLYLLYFRKKKNHNPEIS